MDKIFCTSCNKLMAKEDLEFGEPSGMCYECYYYEQQHIEEEAQELHQITRDMAIDGGCPEREGEYIQW